MLNDDINQDGLPLDHTEPNEIKEDMDKIEPEVLPNPDQTVIENDTAEEITEVLPLIEEAEEEPYEAVNLDKVVTEVTEEPVIESRSEPEPASYHSYPDESSVPEKKQKKSGKSGRVILSALVFGIVAGCTMVAIQAVSGSFINQQITVAESVAESEAETTEVVETTENVVKSIPADLAATADIPSMVEKVMPSVVAINNTMLYQDTSWFGSGQTYEVPSSGSGIIVGENDNELLIVTNNHVVEGSKELQVNFIDNTLIDAAIKGTDPVFDLAVIAVPLEEIPEETRSQISIATLGNSDDLKVGQTVVAIGNALGYGQSVTVGCVSALEREIKTDRDTISNLIQTDAAINPGNSGGALLNMQGEVIGINAAKYSSTEVEGMGYAIPISEVQDIIDQLMNKKTRVEIEKEKQGYLGIQGKDITDAYAAELGMPKGVYVYKILEDGAAAATDLRERDIITKFDDQSIRTMVDLQEMLTYYEGGDTVELTVQSQENGQYVEHIVEVTLGFKPAQEDQ